MSELKTSGLAGVAGGRDRFVRALASRALHNTLKETRVSVMASYNDRSLPEIASTVPIDHIIDALNEAIEWGRENQEIGG